EQRLEQRRLAGSVRADERDVLAALEREPDVVQQLLRAGGHLEALRLDHGPAAPRRVEEIEAEPFLARRQRLELAARLLPLALEPPDLGQLRLRLLRLALLVAEALDEALEPFDVDTEPVCGLAGRRGACSLLDPPGGPGTGEGDRASAAELEHAVRDRFEKPAVVRDEDDPGVERLQLLLEPLEARDVEVVGRLIEEQQIGVAAEGASERCARQLAARERLERPVEIGLGEAEATSSEERRVGKGRGTGWW